MSFLVNPYWYASGCDPDAVAFLTAAGITDPTITSAICTLVTSMKANGTWAKMSAIYPMVGGTATTHKFNLKNPADTNAAFRLSFVGGWTHSANGALPNGSNAYADTFLPVNILSRNSTHISYYSRSNLNTGGIFPYEIGATSLTSSPTVGLGLVLLRLGSTLTLINQNTLASTTVINDTRGHYIGNRILSTQATMFKNGSLVLTTLDNSVNNSVSPLTIWLAANSGLPGNFTDRQCAFATIGAGLSNAEAATLYTDIQTMQTTLSRQV
jgi:hypothetical protein